MGVNIADTAQAYAKKEKARKRFQDKQTRKALVAFVASGTHREVVVKKSNKVKPGKYMYVVDGWMYALCMHYHTSQPRNLKKLLIKKIGTSDTSKCESIF